MTVTLSKHPGPGGSEIHGTGTDQSIHSGGLGVSMTEVSRRKLMLRMDPHRAPEVQKWAMNHIERIRNTANRHESLAGSTIQRLNNLYYTADYYVEEVLPGLGEDTFPEGGKFKLDKPEDPVFSAASREVKEPWYEITPHGPIVAATQQGEEIREAHAQRPDLMDVHRQVHHGVKKGQPDGGGVHTDSIIGVIGNRGKKTPVASKAKSKRKRKKKAKELRYGKGRSLLNDRFNKHYGPGPHANGTPQSVHGSWSTGTSSPAIQGMGREGGFTVDPRTGASPDSGYAVAIDRKYESRIPLTAKSEHAVNRAISDHRARVWSLFEEIEGAHWGGWLEELDGVPTLFLDVSVVTEDLEEAVALGKRYDQFAIFDLGSFSEIRLDDDGQSLSDFIAARVEN